MARMRLQKDWLSYIKEKDPDTALTQNALRQMVLDGTIPHTAVGSKKLVNLDILDELLDHPERLQARAREVAQKAGYGKIRRLS